MKKLLLAASMMVLAAGTILAAGKAKTFKGEIMDSMCAKNGSHEKMYNAEIKTPKDCTNACVKMGGTYVLYDAARKAVYQLDDQEKPKEFAGAAVKVTGTLNKATKTIHVESIAAGS